MTESLRPQRTTRMSPDNALNYALGQAFSEAITLPSGYIAYTTNAGPGGVEVVIHDVIEEESHHYLLGEFLDTEDWLGEPDGEQRTFGESEADYRERTFGPTVEDGDA